MDISLILQTAVIGVALSMDALAVSAANGMALSPLKLRHAFIVAAIFAVAQAIMPLLGYLLGSLFAATIERFAPWVALICLGVIGTKMFIDSLKHHDDKAAKSVLSPVALAVQAVATSIDALVVGVSFPAMGLHGANAFAAVGIIGAVTFIICFVGALLGKKFGSLLGSKAGLIGGTVLVAVGVKLFISGIA
ncbi:MAG: manganese efflux pump MntP family protein [Oscillospiraceae bacterium]|jgi:putative Mn2+ efflux pump MntP|nr:manganese efflux pump MntP family protein [Oscillospiraceae bacterium]